MNNNITEDYCSFEVSKLLKNKGFSVGSFDYYTEHGSPRYDHYNTYNMEEEERKSGYIEMPAHAIAIKWIRENFQLSIEIAWKNTGKIFFGTIYPISPLGGTVEFTIGASTHEEATENALLHILKRST